MGQAYDRLRPITSLRMAASGNQTQEIRAAPAFGGDTGAVLTGLLGLSAADVRGLAERGII